MNQQPVILEKSHWRDIKDLNVEVAILPWGATEPHNYHLPFGTDSFQAAHVATESARMAACNGGSAIVLPTIPFGVNTGQIDLKLCLNIMPSTQLTILSDLADNLIRHQIKKMVIINSHGGNNFTPLIRELSVRKPELFICSIDWWKVCRNEEYFTEPGDHAGELETSVMMSIAPDWVLPLSEAGDGATREFALEGLQQKWVWAQRHWSSISDSTGVGNPKDATVEKGETFVNACILKISKFLVQLSKVEVDKIYKTEKS